MLSFLIVAFCVFITINTETCVEREKEDKSCVTACGGFCRDYSRTRIASGERRDDASCSDESPGDKKVDDCGPILLRDYDDCKTFDEWVDALWGAVTDEEKKSGRLMQRTSGSTRPIPDFIDKWSESCRIQKKYRIVAAGGDDSFSAETSRQEAIDKINHITCGDYQDRDPSVVSIADTSVSGGTRDYFYRDVETDPTHRVLVKYCKKRRSAHTDGKEDRDDYIHRVKARFQAKASAERHRQRVAGEGTATRGHLELPPKRVKKEKKGKTPKKKKKRRHESVPLPSGVKIGLEPPEAVAPPPPPEGPPPATGTAPRGHIPPPPGSVHMPPPPPPPAHEEYVDSLWDKVNEMEEDELRYERALDKLVRARRKFDQLRKTYYN